jgi:peptide/nickel transport system substrate-binding protein
MTARNRSINLGRALTMSLVLLLAACGSGGNSGTSGTAGQQPATTASGAATSGSGAATSGSGAAATTATSNAGAAGANSQQGDAAITISLSADPPKLDPAQSSALVDRQVLNSLCDKLFDLDAQGKVVPMLVSESQLSDDKLTYTFKLREGVKFHDGTDFNADAVKFNLERGMAEASPRKTELEAIKSIEVVDPTTVKVTLKEPFAPLLSILTDRSGMMVSPKAAQEKGDDFLSNPVCSGPFKFQERVKGDHITLVRNDNYWQQGLPKAKQITYRIFPDANTALVNLRSGQVDVTDTLPAKEVPALKQNSKFVVVNEPGLGYQGIYLNTTQPPFDNENVRKAVDLLIDRDTLVKVMFGDTATPGHSPFSESNLAYGESDTYQKPNVEQAKKLLADAGVSNVSFTLKTGTSPANAQLAQLVQNMLKAGGINMQIEKVEFGTLLEQSQSGNYQAVQLGWSGRPDPDQNIYDFIVTGGKNNDSRYSNPQVDDLLRKARAESDQGKRKELYDQVMQALHDDVPYVYLYHQNNLFGMTNNITGFTYVPDGIIRTAPLNKQ